jgi:hypothetical protein
VTGRNSAALREFGSGTFDDRGRHLCEAATAAGARDRILVASGPAP